MLLSNTNPRSGVLFLSDCCQFEILIGDGLDGGAVMRGKRGGVKDVAETSDRVNMWGVI